MQANLMLMREQSDGAIYTYIQLLQAEPDNFNVLANLIELLRRAGRLEEAKQYLDNAESKTQRSKMAGLAYCKGLFGRYNSDPQRALRELNFARFDNFYGGSAIQNMIEIYLNPANEQIYSSILETEYATTPENIQAAKELVEELKVRGVDTSIVECLVLIATKQKANLEQAQTLLKKILTKNASYVPGNVCMGLCLFLLKKGSDARTNLRTVAKMDYQL